MDFPQITLAEPAVENTLTLPEEAVVAVVGLGYVGLPVAAAFGRLRKTIGFDISASKVEELRQHMDRSGEVPSEILASASRLHCTSDPAALEEADFVIVAVPTPVDAAHRPDFTPLINASATVGAHLKPGATVIYESTVYPGATEEICVPILERHSGMRWLMDFHVAYSPERINPGDREHDFQRVVKVVAGDGEGTLDRVARLYGSVVAAGVHRAPSIRVAEAAKVIENTQRDLNIALINELAIIFDRLGLDTAQVLEAAGTKWNFLPFRPGLVGGHCIGVDPYYLTHKAEITGYHPQVILAGRRINDGMGPFVAQKIVQQMIQAGRGIKGGRVTMLGLTFKENCADIRNSKVIDVIRELTEFGLAVTVHDPMADPDATLREYGVHLSRWDDLPAADALVLAVPHRQVVSQPPAELIKRIVRRGCFIDLKSAFDPVPFQQAGISVWRL